MSSSKSKTGPLAQQVEHLTFNQVIFKERPIIISTQLIPATLDGRKTQTRRVIKPQPIATPSLFRWKEDCYTQRTLAEYHCPYGQVGDRLWVRETFQTLGSKQNTVYKADGEAKLTWDIGGRKGEELVKKWRSSIFMPRWASRITLEITGVRVERLQEITDSDCLAEGIPESGTIFIHPTAKGTPLIHAYANLWDSLNAKNGWETNPWVWVISFKLLEISHSTIPSLTPKRGSHENDGGDSYVHD